MGGDDGRDTYQVGFRVPEIREALIFSVFLY
jgi:hypothetical protein